MIPKLQPGQGSAAVAISATFTAEALSPTLDFWMHRLGLGLPVRFAPYNQVFQQLLDPNSLLTQNRGGVNVILVRLEDWVRFRSPDSPGMESIEEMGRYLVSCIRLASESSASPLLVTVCPSSPEFLSHSEQASLAAGAGELLASELREMGAVYFLDPQEQEALYPVSQVHDPHADALGHVPYTPEYFTALGSWLARKINALRMTPYKVAALDCDDTLWRGICGEDGPEGVVIDPPRRELQEFMVAQHDAGMLLCLCSKNNEEDVVETFRAHPEMPLRLEHFVARRINWAPKSANLAALAGELQLGLDSFIFVDDNERECAEVQAGRPEVLTLPLPADAERIPHFLRHVWAFDRIQVTGEDKQRSEMYAQRQERARLEKQAKTLGEFIAALQLEVSIGPMTPDQLPRVSQLTQRTNQMNFTTIRRTEADLQALLRSGRHECYTVHVRDRFGSYGLTGVAIAEVSPPALRLDTFLLSCRVLGRGVEHRLLAWLGEVAREKGLPKLEAPFQPTQRNRPALLFLESVGARYKQPAGKGFVFRFPAEAAAAITYEPSAAVPKQSAAEPAARDSSAEPVDYAYIAANLATVQQIQDQVRAGNRNGAVASAPFAAARTELEQQLVRLWAELLGVPVVGIHDNFFDLGGHSLLAVQLLSRIRQSYQIDLGLDVIYSSAFTVAELAKVIELHQIERSGSDDYARILAEIEGLSDEEVRALLEKESEGIKSSGGH